jgi:hypothetical protein
MLLPASMSQPVACGFVSQESRYASIVAAHFLFYRTTYGVTYFSCQKVTQWMGGSDANRVPLPRKAAFFAVVAAEAMTGANVERSQQKARDLWLLATHLYSNRPNDQGGVGCYGWVGLRAITLNALSLQGNNHTSLIAAEELLSLLSEIESPEPPTDASPDGSALLEVHSPGQPVSNHGVRSSQTSVHGGTSSHGKGSSSTQASSHGARTTQATTRPPGKPPLDANAMPDASSGETMNRKASSFARQLRESFASLTSGSILLAMESRWAENDVIGSADVPLASASVQPLGCAWRLVPLDRCIDAQSQCIALISRLHRSLPTQSLDSARPSPAALPIFVSSVMSMQAETDLELECVKKAVKKESSASSDPMATFFNPFASKRSNKSQAGIVAEGEERAMCVELSNRLSVPLPVLRCQLEFRCEGSCSIRATPLSFTIPPKASGFMVHFPFVVLPIDEPSQRTFEVAGLSMTFAGRLISIPIDPRAGVESVEATERRVPAPASLYHRQTSSVSRASSDKGNDILELPRVESCPPQPRLQVHLAKGNVPVTFERPILVTLAEGELYSLPALRLTNYLGSAGLGKIARLQILSVDVPGMADKLIFDSQVDITPDPAFTPHIERDQPPLILRCLSSSMNFSELNGNKSPGALVTIEISASHRIREHLPKVTSFKLRFRYRGIASATSEFWRKREIRFRVSCIAGPRISSMDFGPNLLATKSYRVVCRVLQSSRNDFRSGKYFAVESNGDEHWKSDVSALRRVGVDSGVHVASADASFILTVSNDTNAALMLSRERGEALGGFPQFPITALLIHPGVTAKIPVIVPRIPREDGTASADYLVDQVTSLTKLKWEVQRHEKSEDDDTLADSYGEEARGYLSIPSPCLRDIIESHPSIVAHVCEPPCVIAFALNNVSASQVPSVSLRAGEPLRACMEVRLASWIPQNALDRCCLTLEFVCTRGNGSPASAVDGTQPGSRMGYVWCGKTRQVFQPKDADRKAVSDQSLKHESKVVFCTSGVYALAACVRLSYIDASENEVWLAPVIAEVNVGNVNPSPSA